MLTPDNSTLRRYLLGDLPEEDRQALEREYFATDEQFAGLLQAEDELLEAFLRNELNAQERVLFERRMATAAGRRTVAIAGALHKPSAPGEERSRISKYPIISALAASLILLLVSGALLQRLMMRNHQLERLQDENRRLAGQAAANVTSKKTYAFVLSPAQERDSLSMAPFVLPREATNAELWLPLRTRDYQRYTASLQTLEGRELLASKTLPPRTMNGRPALVFEVPAAALETGTFVVAVSGIRADGSPEPVEDYTLTVARP